VSGTVDVLVEMDRVEAYADDVARFREARAAVAELIEAANDLIVASDRCCNPGETDDVDAMLMFGNADERLRDALRRITGGQS
jgi:hypothetical protein